MWWQYGYIKDIYVHIYIHICMQKYEARAHAYTWTHCKQRSWAWGPSQPTSSPILVAPRYTCSSNATTSGAAWLATAWCSGNHLTRYRICNTQWLHNWLVRNLTWAGRWYVDTGAVMERDLGSFSKKKKISSIFFLHIEWSSERNLERFSQIFCEIKKWYRE